MIDWLKKRAGVIYTVGGFTSRRAVMRFSLRVTLMVVVIADILNVVVHFSIDAVGYLPYPVVPAATIGVIITTLLAGILTFSVTFINASAIRQLSISHDAFEHMSRTDALSGLLNRRAFLHAINAQTENASLVLFDIDRFKSVNDTYGHEAGDRVIMAVAKVLNETISENQAIARIGGEEFAVLLARGTKQDRLAAAEQARKTLQNNPVVVNETRISITVSGGVAESADYHDYSELFVAADRALYIAKASGRNAVVHDHDVRLTKNQPLQAASSTPSGERDVKLLSVSLI